MNRTERKEIERCRDLAETIWQSDGGEDVSAEIADLKDTLARLLAAPPRNCDRFATVKDAAIAFARERQDAPQPCPDFTFSAWLFAPATKQKGEADEK